MSSAAIRYLHCATTAKGQKRRFERAPTTSGLPRQADTSASVGMSQSVPATEVASYSITSSARASKEGGTVRPSALAVFMLITSSNLVGCSTGRSEGLAPLRILST